MSKLATLFSIEYLQKYRQLHSHSQHTIRHNTRYNSKHHKDSPHLHMQEKRPGSSQNFLNIRMSVLHTRHKIPQRNFSAIIITQCRMTTSISRVFTNSPARIVVKHMWDKQGAPSAPVFENSYGTTDIRRGTPNLPNTSGNKTIHLAQLILLWTYYKYSKKAR